jgi:serine/threonine protein kinase
MSLPAETLLGPYKLLSTVGSGGMGEVYRAIDTRLDRTVAVKLLLPRFAERSEFLRRFDREAHAISKLNHPNICSLYDVGHLDGRSYLVMEYLRGETLAHRLSKSHMTMDEVIAYAIQIASALKEAHSYGIIHRDLKPANIMVTRRGVKLMDFGIAKTRQDAQDERVTAATTAKSKPASPARATSTAALRSKEPGSHVQARGIEQVVYAVGEIEQVTQSSAALAEDVSFQQSCMKSAGHNC